MGIQEAVGKMVSINGDGVEGERKGGLFGEFLEQDGHHGFSGPGRAGNANNDAGFFRIIENGHRFPKEIQIKRFLFIGEAGDVDGLLGDEQ